MGLFKGVFVFAILAPLCYTRQQQLHDLKEEESEFLELLKQNKQNGGNSSISRTRQEIPSYLLNLPNQIAFDKDTVIKAFFREPTDQNHSHDHLFTFNITAMTPSEKIRRASLRIFKRPSTIANASSNFNITVYRLTIPWKKDDQKWQNKLVYLDSKSVTGCHNKGKWIELNVTSAVKYWVMNKSKNYGLWLSVHGQGVPSSDFKVANGGQEDSFMVAFGIDLNKQQQASRDVENEDDTRNGVDEADEEVELLKESPVEATSARSTRPKPNPRCKRYPLWINFKALRWMSWVISPPGYSAYYCKGTCPFPLDAYLKPTNHAVGQNLVHLIEPGKKVPAPCCVPTRLKPITVGYLVENIVVFKQWSKMVAHKCGCR